MCPSWRGTAPTTSAPAGAPRVVVTTRNETCARTSQDQATHALGEHGREHDRMGPASEAPSRTARSTAAASRTAQGRRPFCPWMPPRPTGRHAGALLVEVQESRERAEGRQHPPDPGVLPRHLDVLDRGGDRHQHRPRTEHLIRERDVAIVHSAPARRPRAIPSQRTPISGRGFRSCFFARASSSVVVAQLRIVINFVFAR